MTIQDRINELFEENNNPANSDVAAAIGCTRSNIGSLRKGISKTITPRIGFGLAEYFSVSPKWLMLGKGIKYPAGSYVSDYVADTSVKRYLPEEQNKWLSSLNKLTPEQRLKLINEAEKLAKDNEESFKHLKQIFENTDELTKRRGE